MATGRCLRAVWFQQGGERTLFGKNEAGPSEGWFCRVPGISEDRAGASHGLHSFVQSRHPLGKDSTHTRRKGTGGLPELPDARCEPRASTSALLGGSRCVQPHNHSNRFILNEADACHRDAVSELTQRETCVGKRGRSYQLLSSDPENASDSCGFSPRV